MLDPKKILPFIIFLFISLSYPQSNIDQPAAEYTITPEYRIKNLPFGLIEKVPKYRPVIAVALSGGGSRGIAQIGVLKALEEAGIPIDMIVGTSMGSIIGGLYSAGYSTDQLDSIVRNADWDELLSAKRETDREDLFIDQKVTEDKAIFALRLKGFTPVLPTSLNEGQKLSSYLNLLTFQAPIHIRNSFDDLKVKFRAVCTDLVSGLPVILEKGSLSQAMRASSSVSFFLSPVKMDSLILVDGGLVANIPVRIAFDLGADIVVAVNTTSSLHIREDLNLPWYIADQVVSIPMRLLNEHQLERADIIINPPLVERSANDYTDLEDIISEGYEYTIPLIDDIKSKMDSVFHNNLKKQSFYVKDVHNDNEAPADELKMLRKYAAQDSVSSLEIIHDLYSFSGKHNSEDVSARIFTDSSGTTIDFVSVKNPVLKYVDLLGTTIVNGQKCDSIFSDITGVPYNSSRLFDNICELINFYRINGYSLAEVDSIFFNESTGRLEIFIDEGIISEVRIEGNEHTNRSVITREFPVEAGDYFKYEDAAAGLINLHSTNLFEDITVDVIREPDKNIVVLRVLESTSGLIRFGFRIDNENKTQLSMDIRDENVLGTGTELGMLLFGGTRNRAFVLEHKSNRIFDTYLTYNINAFYQFQNIFSYVNSPASTDHRFSRLIAGEYRQISYGTSLAVGTQVERLGNLIFKGKYQFDQVKNLTGSSVGPYKIKIVSLKVSSTIDSQNKYPYPTNGIYFTGSYESATSFLGGDIGFTNVGFDYKSHFTFNDVHTLSPRIMMGFGDKTLPLSQHYSLGGQSSFFGMREHDFRGRQIFVSSLEYTAKLPVQIFFDTYFKLRYDLGSAWDVQEEIRFKDLKHGVGGTVSFDTPVGPADFSVGQSFIFKRNLPENPVSLGELHFYFSIGYYY